jgi:anti-sigma factor RsiW
MTSHCPQEQISAWLDRQLGAEEAAQVEQHLRQCEPCRRFQKELELTGGLFRNLEVLEPPDYLWTRVATILNQPARPGRLAWLRAPELWLSYRRELMAVAAALIIMLAGVVLIVERRNAKESEVAAIAQIDRYHAALTAKNPEIYNPFRISAGLNPDSNPFARRRFDANANPFGSARERR